MHRFPAATYIVIFHDSNIIVHRYCTLYSLKRFVYFIGNKFVIYRHRADIVTFSVKCFALSREIFVLLKLGDREWAGALSMTETYKLVKL